MTTYMELDRCQVVCTCRCTNTLCRLYFCRHCLDIRCSDCVSHEVDSHYCPNCLENMASAEAKMRKHRCGNCFDCPSCGQVLSTRATAVMASTTQPADDPQNKVVPPQKAYYLACVFCRWTTRDGEIPDQRQPAGMWQERDNPHAKRISELIDSYHYLAVKEKSDREWRKFERKRNYMMLLDRYPVLNPRLRRFCGSTWTTPNRNTEPEKQVNIPAAEAPPKPDQFDVESYIGKPLQLERICNIQQRHLAPQFQPKLVSDLEPHAKSLAVKRSMRCRTCEHNLSKADFNPSSIKFRINLNAIYHVPELRYMLPDLDTAQTGSRQSSSIRRRTSVNMAMLKAQRLIHHHFAAGKLQPFVLTLSNPAHRITTVTLRQLTVEEEADYLQHLILPTQDGKKMSSSESVVGSSGDAPQAPIFSTVQLTLPTDEIELAPRNDIAEYDDHMTPASDSEFKDDPSVFVFRRRNKVGLRAALTPLVNPRPNRCTFAPLVPLCEEQAVELPPTKQQSSTVPLRAAVRLRFDYKNTTTTSLLSEQRAAALAASVAAANASASATSAVKAGRDSVDGVANTQAAATLPSGAASTEDELKQIEVTVLMHFGEMALK